MGYLSAGKAAYEISKRVIYAESGMLKKAGYSKEAIYGIRSGIGVASVWDTFKMNAPDSPGNGSVPWSKTGSIQYKTRFRFKCNPNRRYPVGHRCYGRRPNSRSYYSKSSRYRR